MKYLKRYNSWNVELYIENEDSETPFECVKLITEKPDAIYYNDVDIDYMTNNAYPFAVDREIKQNRIKIGKERDYHDGNIELINKYYKYPGRIWLDDKILSFWVYPNKEEFKKIINELEQHFKIKIFNNKWRIEIIIKDNNGKFNLNNIVSDKHNDYYNQYHEKGYTEKLISVDEYIGSKNSDKKTYQLHLMNAKDKSNKLKEIGYKPKRKKFKEWEKPFEAKLIRENCDNVYLNNDKSIEFYDSNTYPFKWNIEMGYLGVGEESTTHSDNDIFDDYYNYNGRIWLDDKIISFWVYPNKNEFKLILKELENNFDIKIFNNDWRIEIYVQNVENKNKNNFHLISVDKYVGGNRLPEELFQLHLLNAKDKSKKLKEIGHKPKIKQFKEWEKPFESIKLITEDPDNIDIDNVELSLEDEDSVAFTTDVNNDKVIVSFENGKSHYQMQKDYMKRKLKTPSGSGIGHTTGRLWLDSKIISFWHYEQDINISLKDLENDLKRKNHINKNDTIFGTGWRIEDDNGKLTPLEKFNGVKYFNKDKYQLHLLSPIDKSNKLKEMGHKPKTKKFKEWEKPFENNDYKKCEYNLFVDMDGVLTDFNNQFNKSFLNDFNKKNKENLKTSKQFTDKYGKKSMWNQIKKQGLSTVRKNLDKIIYI